MELAWNGEGVSTNCNKHLSFCDDWLSILYQAESEILRCCGGFLGGVPCGLGASFGVSLVGRGELWLEGSTKVKSC